VRILITGAGGQLGRDLQDALRDHELVALGHSALDVVAAAAVNDALDSSKPNVVVHAAALTDTTRCEREPDLAHAVNAQGARNVAAACARLRAAMVYVSTNEVFDGAKASPYAESDQPDPVNAYGRSKLAGERLVQAVLPQHYIVRTAWLYGLGGNHFVSKMLRAADGGELIGVTDEVATPTWTRDLAEAIARLIETERFGVYHLTNAGQASRYDWVQEILRLAGKETVAVRPVTTAEFRASLQPGVVAPKKPPFSVLANTAATALGIELRPWQDALAAYFDAGG
jgi:dTDP-4-dehydrorhamnose reductase